MITSPFQRKVFHIFIVVFISLVAYSNTFSVPFQLDDRDAIAENPVIKDFQYFLEPSQAESFTDHFGYHTFRSRYIAYLTFALNYSIHGLDTTGYHIVNIIIHICASLLVYHLVTLTFQTPRLRTSDVRDSSRQAALLAALFFAVHPVQTEAVTYIWQRTASLATLLYLLSLSSYVTWRLLNLKGEQGAMQDRTGQNPPQARSNKNQHREKRHKSARLKSAALYLMSLLCALLAMKTKQIAFTLPLVIVLYEALFFHGKRGRRILSLLPFLLTMPVIPLTLLELDQPPGDIIGDIGQTSRDLTQMSRLDYFSTQLRVIVTYFRLLFLPLNQNLDYDYPLARGFFTAEILLSLLFLLSIVCLALYLLYRSGRSCPQLRIISFGIFWFFIALSVESSLIPIREIIFEYRLYLPSVGISFAMSSVFLLALQNIRARSGGAENVLKGLLVLLILIFTGLTLARNSVWRDETTLWEDVVSKSPGKGRPHMGLGNAYKSRGLFAKAIEQYRIAMRLNPYDLSVYNNLGNAYLSLGNLDTAIQHLQRALRLKADFAEAHYNIANAYKSKGLLDKAIEHYRSAIRLSPDDPDAHNNIGTAYQSMGLIDKGIEHYRTAVELNPDFVEAHYNLGVAYSSKGLTGQAAEHFSTVQRLNPALLENRW